MGSYCSCFRGPNGSTDPGVTISDTRRRHGSSSDLDQINSKTPNTFPKIHISKMQKTLQALARGYQTRKTLLKNVQPFLPPENFHKLTTLDYTEIQGSLSEYILSHYGEFDNSKPLEDGIPVKMHPALRLEGGVVYKGEWNFKHQKHGRGIELEPDGTEFFGYFKNNERSGKGRLVKSNGNFYEGMFKLGKPNGKGMYIHEDGSKYIGNFVNGIQQGEGKEIYLDGSCFEGKYLNGVKSGLGVFRWIDGKVYRGNFEENELNGYGVYSWPNGEKFEGNWVRGKRNGEGHFSWEDGREYVGEYLNDKKHGFGKYVWPGVKMYEGEWRYDVEHGEGCVTFKNPKGEVETRKGIWDRGKLVS